MANTSAIFFGAQTKLLTSAGLFMGTGQKIQFTDGAAAGNILVSDALGNCALSALTSSQVTTALGFTPQPAGTYVTSVTGSAPVVSSGGATPAISMAAATDSVDGYLTHGDHATFNAKQPALPMTTLGDTIYGGALGVATRLPGNTSNQRVFLREMSVGSVATAPVWDALIASDIPNPLNQNTTGTASNITATTNSTLTTLPNLALPGIQVTGNITGNAGNVNGTVAIGNGGTGATTAPAALTALGAQAALGILPPIAEPTQILQA
jgi:hypothetical protein